MALALFPSIEATFLEIERIKGGAFTEAAIPALCDIGCDGRQLPPPPADPFSAAYRAYVLDVWRAVSGRANYTPEVDEHCPLDISLANRPAVYRSASSSQLGGFLEGAGLILQKLDLKPGHSFLEYGSGEGQIALHLARMGVDVSLIDIEPAYLQMIEVQAERLGVKVRTKHGSFSDDYGEERFDCIFFYEAFHHALDHIDLMHRLRDRVTPGGRVVLAAEPIQWPHDYWRAVIPYAWGPRLDGLSLNATRTLGWMELGFRSEYIEALALKTGWKAEYSPSRGTGLAHCWMFTRHEV